MTLWWRRPGLAGNRMPADWPAIVAALAEECQLLKQRIKIEAHKKKQWQQWYWQLYNQWPKAPTTNQSDHHEPRAPAKEPSAQTATWASKLVKTAPSVPPATSASTVSSKKTCSQYSCRVTKSAKGYSINVKIPGPQRGHACNCQSVAS